jgi:tripartite-type tricarboxylate transporter receptor subunit TctC
MNKVGGIGMVAFQTLIDSKPDGYTLEFITLGSNGINFALNPNWPQKWDNMTAIGHLLATPCVITVPADSKYKTLEDLLNDIRKNPGKLRAATTQGTIIHLFKAGLLKEAGLDPVKSVIYVPFKGEGPAVISLVGGHEDFGGTVIYSSAALLEAGKLRALAVTGDTRVKAYPNVPCLTELGYPEANILSWRGLIGPPGLPEHIVDFWSKAITELQNNKEWAGNCEKQGDVISSMSPEQFKNYMGKQIQKYTVLGEALGLVNK